MYNSPASEVLLPKTLRRGIPDAETEANSACHVIKLSR